MTRSIEITNTSNWDGEDYEIVPAGEPEVGFPVTVMAGRGATLNDDGSVTLPPGAQAHLNVYEGIPDHEAGERFKDGEPVGFSVRAVRRRTDIGEAIDAPFHIQGYHPREKKQVTPNADGSWS